VLLLKTQRKKYRHEDYMRKNGTDEWLRYPEGLGTKKNDHG
jgi:hypothetical protein